MAYNPKNLSMQSAGVHGQNNSFSYVSPDTLDANDATVPGDAFAVISAANYISDAQDRGMRVGDVVTLTDRAGGTGIRQCTALSATGAATLGALL